jgi:hypothetical protein
MLGSRQASSCSATSNKHGASRKFDWEKAPTADRAAIADLRIHFDHLGESKYSALRCATLPSEVRCRAKSRAEWRWFQAAREVPQNATVALSALAKLVAAGKSAESSRVANKSSRTCAVAGLAPPPMSDRSQKPNRRNLPFFWISATPDSHKFERFFLAGGTSGRISHNRVWSEAISTSLYDSRSREPRNRVRPGGELRRAPVPPASRNISYPQPDGRLNALVAGRRADSVSKERTIQQEHHR